MDQQPPEQTQNKPAWLTRKEYTDLAEKKKDFRRGFWLWWGLNVLLCLTSWLVSAFVTSPLLYSQNNLANSAANALTLVLGLVPFVINVGLMIYFAFTRSQIALGMLAAFGAALAVVIVLGVIFTIACFVMLGSSNG
jgi:uncharacterized membrane protein